MARGEIGESKRAEVVRMRVDGATVTEIAKALDVEPSAISRTMQAPDVKAAIAGRNQELLEAVRDNFVNAQMLAWRTMVSLLRSENEAIRLAASKDILDRGPMVRGANVSLTAETAGEDLASLSIAQLRALAGEEDVMVLDITPESK